MAREIRILHTADTHLGYKQYHSEPRRNDFFAAFELVVNDAVEMQVDAVVHAGDLFDSRNPTLEDLLETMNLLSRLKAADIPFFGIVGNHESKQNTQWLDLFEEMGLAARLGKKPLMVSNVAIYGIDSVPKSKIPIFDYSGFEAPDSTFSSPTASSTSAAPSTPSAPTTPSTPSTPPVPSALAENCWKLLVMHQIMSPFPYAEWDCDEVLENLPFRVDAVLLGDYHEHAIIKNKTGETWITYPGSTERNSVSENGARSYNIITLSEEGLEISKRTIPTRKFLSIPPIELTGEDKPYEQIFSAVDEYLEEIPESVVFLEISGDSGAVLSFSELEGYLLNKGALVAQVKDRRIKESVPEEVLNVTFSDPDYAVSNEIRRMSLNDGGLIIDEIVRSPNISKSRVDEEAEVRLSKLIAAKAMDFKSPDFRVEIPASTANPASLDGLAPNAEFLESEEVESSDEVESSEYVKPVMGTDFLTKAKFAGEAGFAGKIRPAGLIAGKLEITELSGILRTSDRIENVEKKSTAKSTEVSKGIKISAASLNGSGLVPESNSGQPSNSEPPELPDSELTELPNGSIVPSKSDFPPKASVTPEKNPEKGIKFLKDKDTEPEIKSESKAETKSETKLEGRAQSKAKNKPESKVDTKQESGLTDSGPEKETRKLSELGAKNKPDKETPAKTGKLPEEKPSRASELAGKIGKAGQKKGKGKTAVPRQHNLGDYL